MHYTVTVHTIAVPSITGQPLTLSDKELLREATKSLQAGSIHKTQQQLLHTCFFNVVSVQDIDGLPLTPQTNGEKSMQLVSERLFALSMERKDCLSGFGGLLASSRTAAHR